MPFHEGIKEALEDIRRKVTEPILLAFQGVKQALSSISRSIREALQDAFTTIVTPIQIGFTSIKSLILDAFTDIKLGFKWGLGKLLSPLKELLKEIGNSLRLLPLIPTKILEGIKGIIDGFRESLQSFLNRIASDFKQFFGTWRTALYEVVKTIMVGIREAVEFTINHLVPVLIDMGIVVAKAIWDAFKELEIDDEKLKQAIMRFQQIWVDTQTEFVRQQILQQRG